MVKNKTGGSKHKKMAKKHNEPIKRKTRFKNPSESCEMYAIVTKNFGQGHIEVSCNDEKVRICVIRNKFKGRNKRTNKIYVGGNVLIGLRDWETSRDNKKEKCDLLEVYNNNEAKDLQKDISFNHKFFKMVSQSFEKKEEDDQEDNTNDYGFEFIRPSQLNNDNDDTNDEKIDSSQNKKVKFQLVKEDPSPFKDNGEIDFSLI